MKIAIMVAMDKELNLFLPLLGEYKEINADGLNIYNGRIAGHDIYLSKCGIGKVNSAINTYIIIKKFSPDLVVNTGVAGGAGNGVKIGTLLVAEYAAYHDVWCGPGTLPGAFDGGEVYLPCQRNIIDLARELLNQSDVAYGLICSGDRFISTAQEVSEIKRSFPDVMAVDMESASIAQVCTMQGIPFNILRIVSDTPGEGENISQYQDFWVEAPQKTFHAVKILLENLK